MSALPGFCWLLRMLNVAPNLQLVDELVALGTTGDHNSTTYSIDSDQAFDDYLASRFKGLCRYLQRSMESIAAQDIQIVVEFGSDRDTIRNAIVLYGKLENRRWKGTAGTATHGNNEK